MIKKINQAMSPTMRNDDGSALVIVMLLLTAILGMMSLVMGSLLLSSFKTRESRDRAAYGSAIDTGINDALNVANTFSGSYIPGAAGEQGIYSHIGYVNQKEGVLESDTASANLSANGLVRWRWWASPVASSVTNSRYNIYIAAFRGNNPAEDDNALFAKATLDSQSIIGYTINGTGDITYQLTNAELYQQGFMGESNVRIYDNAKFYSYDSATQGAYPNAGASTANPQITTNNDVQLYLQADNTYDVNNIFLGRYNRSGLENRCYLLNASSVKIAGNNCPTSNVQSSEYSVAPQPVSAVADSMGCTAGVAAGKGSWVASSNGNTLAPNLGSDVLCVQNMTFDGVGITSFGTGFSTGKPLYIFARGNITIAPGHRINPPQNSPVYGTPALRFFSTGDMTMGTTTVDPGDSRAYGLYSVDGSCKLAQHTTAGTYANAYNQVVEVYGSLSCGGVLTVGKSVNMWFDRQSNSVASDVNSGPISRVWSQTDFRTVTSGELDASYPY